MPRAERKLTDFIKKYFEYFLLAAALAAGILIRVLLLSAYAVPEDGGGNALHVAGDLVLAFSSMIFVQKFTGDRNRGMAIRILMLILPSVFISSAMCGSLENLSFAFCMLALILLEKKDGLKGMLLYAAACGVSFYAWPVLPFIIKVYGSDKTFKKLYYLMPAAAALIRACLDISYIPTGFTAKHLYENCGSFFAFLNGNGAKSFGRYLPICFVLLIFLLYMLMKYFDTVFNTKNETDRLIVLLIITEAVAAFIPGADMRSTAFGSLLAWCVAFTDIKFLPVAIVLGYLRILPMTGVLYGAESMTFSLQAQGWIRIAVIIAAYALTKLKRDRKHVL